MNPNSALIWLPKIGAAGLPTPKTIIVPYDHHACLSIFDGEHSAEFERLSGAVSEAAQEIGWPVFIRTDLGSAKHSGPNAFKVRSSVSTAHVLSRLIEDQEMKFWTERFGPAAILVREFLTLSAPFTAFGGLPIAREFRFFADSERVHCWHPYWPIDSIEGHGPSAGNWRELLAEIHTVPKVPELWLMAVAAARAVGGGSWSVDFCEDVNGKWWLADMAVAADSFHWEACDKARTP